MIEVLWEMIKESGSQRRTALSLNISDSYLSDLLRRKRSFSDSLARRLGYVKLSIYEAHENV